MEDKWGICSIYFQFKINNNIYKEIEIIIIIFIGEIFALDFERNYSIFFFYSFVLYTSKLFVFTDQSVHAS